VQRQYLHEIRREEVARKTLLQLFSYNQLQLLAQVTPTQTHKRSKPPRQHLAKPRRWVSKNRFFNTLSSYSRQRSRRHRRAFLLLWDTMTNISGNSQPLSKRKDHANFFSNPADHPDLFIKHSPECMLSIYYKYLDLLSQKWMVKRKLCKADLTRSTLTGSRYHRLKTV
jgi:hypothetical protein